MRDVFETLMNAAIILCMVVMFLSVLFLCAWMYPPLHEAKKLDCSMVEFSPDIAADVKKACREARGSK